MAPSGSAAHDALVNPYIKLPFYDSLPEAAKSDFSILRHRIFRTQCVNEDQIALQSALSSYKDGWSKYSGEWDDNRDEVEEGLLQIEADMTEFRNRWETVRLWDQLEGLRVWWDVIHTRVSGWGPSLAALVRPTLKDFQAARGSGKVSGWLSGE
ncbi:hypothetical protein MMC08_001531 [Hypocenomyce scalaris]|nr:hypothetical protein [Hypocenomyce scalaris]